ncbi:hypothetical protein U27_05162 [Candidatus Vecturithrix granuli]|uniref:Uncharacterized protein n=1 Tax=Vecturithrix granuli TaxID=1499967 RepID=A0A081C0T4_VECG1|nr:hypothetical protein U27_05162 [Candidatus Vecturithrix granuli]
MIGDAPFLGKTFISQQLYYQGGGPAPIYAADGIQPGKQPALWLPFDWGQLRPVHEPSLELTDKPYLKDPNRPDEDNLDSIFLLRDDMTVLSGDGKLSDANGWWTAWAGRGDLLLTRLRPNAFTLPGYVPPPDALSDSPPVEIDASDMNPWVAEVMTGSPDLYEPPNMTYNPPLGNHVTNDLDDDRRAQVWLQPDYEPQRAPYTLIGQAYDFPLVTGALHTAYADLCPLTQDAEGNDTCVPHPYFSPNAPQAGVPPAERTTPVYLFPAPETPDEEVWLELSATWWDTRTKEEQQAQSGDAGGVEIAHPKGILTSLTPDGASHLEQRLHWRLVTPPNRPDLLETLPATIEFEPFTRLVPHARLNISEPGMYDIELVITGDDGDVLLLDKAQVLTQGVDLDAFWPGTKDEPGPPVPDAEEDDPLNLFTSVNDDDDKVDNIVDHDPIHSPIIDAEDDEIITLIIRQLTPETLPGSGTGTLTLTASEGLRLFQADGLLTLDTADLSLDLTNPTGPLANALTQDVVLLLEAYHLSENTRLELVYTEDGQEVARDEVYLVVIQSDISGGFRPVIAASTAPTPQQQSVRTKNGLERATEADQGNFRWAEALRLTDQYGHGISHWLVCESPRQEEPLTVLFPIPQYKDQPCPGLLMRYKEHDASDADYQFGCRLETDKLEALITAWNALLKWLGISFWQYEPGTLTAWLSAATGIPEEKFSGYFMTHPEHPLTKHGEYDIGYCVTNEAGELRCLPAVSLLHVRSVDLDIDSDNNDGFDVPPLWEPTDAEDAIEDEQAKPGKFIAVNDGDADNDGIPDFVDFDTNVAYPGNDPVRFTPLVLTLQEPLDLQKVKVRFTYSDSDPGQIAGSGTEAAPYQAALGHLRIWNVGGNMPRSAAEVNTPGGHFVKSGAAYNASDLGAGRVITFYVEGIQEGAKIADQQIKVEIDPNGDGGEPGFIGEDAVRVTVIRVDLDIDSDNNNGGFGGPARTPYEDQIEDHQDNATKPGKLIAANLGNIDEEAERQVNLYNEVPNFADGFDKYNNQGPNAGGNFTPIMLELPEPLELEKVKIRLIYSGSDPNNVTQTGQGTIQEPYRYVPALGHLRIWKVDGAVSRKMAKDYVKPNSVYKASDLGPGRTITLYVEGIDASAELADRQIKVEVDPNGDAGKPDFLCQDAVRVTIIKPDIVSPQDRADYDVSEENFTTTPAIPFQARIVPTALNWQGQIDWTLQVEYDTTQRRGPWTGQKAFATANDATHEDRYTSEGGRVKVKAIIPDFADIADLMLENSIVITITGVPVPDDVITDRLINLYNGATPNLLTGIAMVESGCYCQFFNILKYSINDRWPRESEEDDGSHIGLMQVPVNMEDAWNWLTNTQTGADILIGNITQSHTYENRERRRCGIQLRALTEIEHENNALSIYRIGRYYYIPNATCNGWIVNPNNPVGVNYVDNLVRQNLR